MGKLKVSFTTALFVFSFIVCVIVAVVFVDRAPRNEYDSFYEDESSKSSKQDSDAGDWGSNTVSEQKPAAASPSPPAAEATFADLPLDPHLKDSTLPVAPTATPMATANPMAGRTPEEIARSVMGQNGISPALNPATVPGMAVPPGMTTPATAPGHTPAARQQMPSQYLPLQSNVGSSAAPGIGTGPPSTGYYNGLSGTGTGMPSLGSNSTNVVDGWNPVSARSTPDNMIGIRSAPSNPQSGMMISEGHMQTGADAPPGFSSTPTSHEPSQVAPPGDLGTPLLLPPQSETGANKWELPPAPTLRPPPVQDPDRRRSEADADNSDTGTPDNLNPDGTGGQALAVSGTDGEEPAESADAEDEKSEFAAQVNDRTLTPEQALKLAEVKFIMTDDILTEDKRDAEVKKAAEQWASVTAAAEYARKNNVTVGAPDVEKYAAMRPDFDPAAWQAAMAEKGFSIAEIRQQLTDIALSEKLVEIEFEKEIADEDIREAYEKSPSKYATARQVHLQEIYKDKPDDEKQHSKVESSMRRLQRQAASGTDFGLLARQASQLPNRQKGGDLGWITPSENKDELRDKAIADLEPGGVSEVVEEPDGYRIYKLVDVKEARDDFKGGKDLVVAELKKSIREDSLTEAREKLESDTPLVNDVIKTASAEEPGTASDQEQEDPGSEAGQTEEEDAEDAARKAKARQVLAAARERKRAAERQQLPQQPVGPVTVTQEPGMQNQLLYAPGSQVQQLAGRQTPATYGQNGQLPVPPVQSPLTAPDSVSVNYPPGQTMRVDGAMTGSGEMEALRAAAAAQASMNQPDYRSSQNVAPDPYQMSGQPYPAQQDEPQETTMHSNGWTVTKVTNQQASRPGAGGPGNAATRGATAVQIPTDSGQASASSQSSATVPPGFEGSGQTVSAAQPDTQAAPAEQEPENNNGLIGNVKSFFTGFRR